MAEHQSGQFVAQSQRTLLELSSCLDIYSGPSYMRKTHVICTIGPVSRSVETLEKLIAAGMGVVRNNFSHGTHEYHTQTIKNAREAIAKQSKPVAIALDTKGPEIRTGLLAGADENPGLDLILAEGDKVHLTTDDKYKEASTKDNLWIDYKNITKVLDVGGLIYIDDGLISLKVTAKSDDGLDCEVVNAGKIGSRKGCNLPDVDVDLPAVSVKDKSDLEFGVEQGVDMIFASFIRKRSDVQAVREVLGEKGKHILIISKIENHEGIRNFDEILDESDGIMVARGDLGIEIPAEKVFLAQKMMIAKCNRVGKPVICATQMLESMVGNPRPTRAEGSDVANAVLDGSDCVMLSGETAKGKFPLEAVSMMARIAVEAEGAIYYRQMRDELRLVTKKPFGKTETCALAAVDASINCGARAIVCLTTSGKTARLLSKWRPLCPILAVTRVPHVGRQLQLHRGTYPMVYEDTRGDKWTDDVDTRFKWAMASAADMGILKSGETVIGVCGWKTGPGFTNTVRILIAP